MEFEHDWYSLIYIMISYFDDFTDIHGTYAWKSIYINIVEHEASTLGFIFIVFIMQSQALSPFFPSSFPSSFPPPFPLPIFTIQ